MKPELHCEFLSNNCFYNNENIWIPVHRSYFRGSILRYITGSRPWRSLEASSRNEEQDDTNDYQE